MVHHSIYRLHFENIFSYRIYVKVYVFDSWYTEKFCVIPLLSTHVE